MSYTTISQELVGNDQMELISKWFEMLKELRNGTISYIQLIKREQMRPPVRPVCRRLGKLLRMKETIYCKDYFHV
jgi:hypothetical protein